MTYMIKRFYQNHESEVLVKGLTLDQAQAHCADKETSFNTCTNEAGLQRTKEKGPWFDGYEEEE